MNLTRHRICQLIYLFKRQKCKRDQWLEGSIQRNMFNGHIGTTQRLNLTLEHHSMITYTSLFAMIFVGGLIVSVLAQIRKKRRSKFHTVRSLLIHYFINRFVYLLGAKARRRLEKDTKSFPQVQETFLLNILRKNSKTKYGREFKFQEIRSCRDFTDVHPITKYDHYKPFVGKWKDELNMKPGKRTVCM